MKAAQCCNRNAVNLRVVLRVLSVRVRPDLTVVCLYLSLSLSVVCLVSRNASISFAWRASLLSFMGFSGLSRELSGNCLIRSLPAIGKRTG